MRVVRRFTLYKTYISQSAHRKRMIHSVCSLAACDKHCTTTIGSLWASQPLWKPLVEIQCCRNVAVMLQCSIATSCLATSLIEYAATSPRDWRYWVNQPISNPLNDESINWDLWIPFDFLLESIGEESMIDNWFEVIDIHEEKLLIIITVDACFSIQKMSLLCMASNGIVHC